MSGLPAGAGQRLPQPLPVRFASPAMRAAPDRWVWCAALALMTVLALGCSGRNAKPTVADRQVEAATEVLTAMAQGLKTRDAGALARLWQPARRDVVGGRIREALQKKGAIDITLSLVGVRVEPERRVARVAWQGTWGGEPLSGGFEMELSTTDPPVIMDIRGEDPTGGAPGGGPSPAVALPTAVP